MWEHRDGNCTGFGEFRGRDGHCGAQSGECKLGDPVLLVCFGHCCEVGVGMRLAVEWKRFFGTWLEAWSFWNLKFGTFFWSLYFVACFDGGW